MCVNRLCALAPSWASRRYCILRCKTNSSSVRPNVLANEDWLDEPLWKVCFLNRSAPQNPNNPIEQRTSSPTDATKPVGTRWGWRGRNWLVFDFNEEPPYLTQNRLSFFPGEKSKFVCENAVTSGGGTDWVDTGARRGWCLFGRGGNNLREPGPLNYLHNHCRRGECTTSSYFLPSFLYVCNRASVCFAETPVFFNAFALGRALHSTGVTNPKPLAFSKRCPLGWGVGFVLVTFSRLLHFICLL